MAKGVEAGLDGLEELPGLDRGADGDVEVSDLDGVDGGLALLVVAVLPVDGLGFVVHPEVRSEVLAHGLPPLCSTVLYT